jgi:predicted RNA-binding protein YlqC (UPF0109 family)
VVSELSRTADTDALLQGIVENLVDSPDDVSVEKEEHDGKIAYQISVNPDDVGKVIGRQGRIIKALRVVMRAAGSVNGDQVDVDVLG